MTNSLINTECTLSHWRAAMRRAPARLAEYADTPGVVLTCLLNDAALLDWRNGGSASHADIKALDRSFEPPGSGFVMLASAERFGDLIDYPSLASLRPWLDATYAAWCGGSPFSTGIPPDDPG